MKHFSNAIAIIAYRDLLKFMNDKGRIIATFIFPFVFIGILGNSLQANLGKGAGFNFLAFTFTGVLAQTLFQSSASGVISLIEDRENDFSQEMFVSPISRYAIIIGKILGESFVALVQAIGILLFAVIVRIPLSFDQVIAMIPAMLIGCLLGGAFGILVLSNLSSQRAANQVFPFIMLPQFFLAGVFSPIKNLPWYLIALSRISPMTYVVDITRIAYFTHSQAFSIVTLYPLWVDLIIIIAIFLFSLFIGTFMFVRNERNQ